MALKVKCNNKGGLKEIDYKDIGILQGGLKEFTPEGYEKLKNSIRKFGFKLPFFLWWCPRDSKFKTLDGRGRLTFLLNEEAFINTPGNRMLPYVEIFADSEKEAAEIILVTSSQYQKVLGLDDFLIEFGIDDDFLEGFTTFGDFKLSGEDEDDEEIADDTYNVNHHLEDVFTQTGDLYELKDVTNQLNHFVLCGDALEPTDVKKALAGTPCKQVFSDPPYGIDFDTDYSNLNEGGLSNKVNIYPKIEGDKQPFLPEYWLAHYKKCFFFGANCFSERLPLGNWLVWDKRHESGKSFLADAEVAWYNGNGAVHIVSYTKQGFIGIEGKSMHPTQKPVKLLALTLKKINADPVILDPFSGSGSTMIAANITGRNSRNIEKLPYYCDVHVKRWLVYCRKNEIETVISRNGLELTEEQIKEFLK